MDRSKRERRGEAEGESESTSLDGSFRERSEASESADSRRRSVRPKVSTSTQEQQQPARTPRSVRASGGKDRHSKVQTAKGLRDRRVRLSVATAIQFYDVQDRLGFDQPSKAVEWLLKKAKDAIDELPPVAASSVTVSTSVSPFSPPPIVGKSPVPVPSRLYPLAGIAGYQEHQEQMLQETDAGKAESRVRARERARDRTKERTKEASGVPSEPSTFTAHPQQLRPSSSLFEHSLMEGLSFPSFTSLLQAPPSGPFLQQPSVYQNQFINPHGFQQALVREGATMDVSSLSRPYFPHSSYELPTYPAPYSGLSSVPSEPSYYRSNILFEEPNIPRPSTQFSFPYTTLQQFDNSMYRAPYIYGSQLIHGMEEEMQIKDRSSSPPPRPP